MSEKTTFTHIVDELSNATGKSHTLSHDFASKLTELIVSGAVEEGKAAMTNFGSFKVVDVSEREGVNPQTGESIIIPAHQRLAFTPYKALGKKVNAPFSHLESTVLDEAIEPKKPEPKEPSAPLIKEEIKEQASEETKKIEAEEKDTTPKKEPSAPPVFKRPGKPQRSPDNTLTALIIIVLVFVVMGGIWWFFLRDTSQPQMAEQTPVENNTTPAEETTPPPAQDAEAQTPAEEEVATQLPESVPENDASTPIQDESLTETTPTGEIPSTYEVIGGEWFYDIARKTYGRAILWPLIFAENYSSDQNPDRIQPGPVLTIPALEGSPNTLSEADEEKLAAAILTVAEAYRNAGNTEQADAYSKMAELYSN